MRTLPRLFVVAIAMLAGLELAGAQAVAPTVAPIRVQATIVLTWAAVSTADDNSTLAPADAITSYQVYESTAPIADAPAVAPFAIVDGKTLTATWVGTPQLGAVVQFRMRACNTTGCGALTGPVSWAAPTSLPRVPGVGALNLNGTFKR